MIQAALLELRTRGPDFLTHEDLRELGFSLLELKQQQVPKSIPLYALGISSIDREIKWKYDYDRTAADALVTRGWPALAEVSRRVSAWAAAA